MKKRVFVDWTGQIVHKDRTNSHITTSHNSSSSLSQDDPNDLVSLHPCIIMPTSNEKPTSPPGKIARLSLYGIIQYIYRYIQKIGQIINDSFFPTPKINKIMDSIYVGSAESSYDLEFILTNKFVASGCISCTW